MYGHERGWSLNDQISGKLFKSKGLVNTLHNLICLSPSFHCRWYRADFGLKFLEQGRDEEKHKYFMKLGFYWMRKTRPNQGQFSQTAHDILASLPLRPRATKAVNIETNARIIDGDIITIWGDLGDLPDAFIIQYRWDVVRMASLCGGAETVADDEEDEDDENNVDEDEDDYYR